MKKLFMGWFRSTIFNFFNSCLKFIVKSPEVGYDSLKAFFKGFFNLLMQWFISFFVTGKFWLFLRIPFHLQFLEVFRTLPSNLILLKTINLLIHNAPFLYSLKTSANRKVFWCFQRVEKGSTGSEWVKKFRWRFHHRCLAGS